MIQSLFWRKHLFLSSLFLVVVAILSLVLTISPAAGLAASGLSQKGHASNGHENTGPEEAAEVVLSDQELAGVASDRDNSQLGLRVILITIVVSSLGLFTMLVWDKRKRKKRGSQ